MPKEMGMPREMRNMTNGTKRRVATDRAANSVPGTQLSPRGHQVLSQSRKTDKNRIKRCGAVVRSTALPFLALGSRSGVSKSPCGTRGLFAGRSPETT